MRCGTQPRGAAILIPYYRSTLHITDALITPTALTSSSVARSVQFEVRSFDATHLQWFPIGTTRRAVDRDFDRGQTSVFTLQYITSKLRTVFSEKTLLLSQGCCAERRPDDDRSVCYIRYSRILRDNVTNPSCLLSLPIPFEHLIGRFTDIVALASLTEVYAAKHIQAKVTVNLHPDVLRLHTASVFSLGPQRQTIILATYSAISSVNCLMYDTNV